MKKILGFELTDHEVSIYNEYCRKAEAEQNRIAPLVKNRLSCSLDIIRQLIFDKYFSLFQKAIGIDDNHIIQLTHPPCLKDYPKKIWELESEDYDELLRRMEEEGKRRRLAEPKNNLSRQLEEIINCINLHKEDHCINQLEYINGEVFSGSILEKIKESLVGFYKTRVPPANQGKYEFVSRKYRITVESSSYEDIYYVNCYATDASMRFDGFDKCLNCGSSNVANGVFGSTVLTNDNHKRLKEGNIFLLPAAYDHWGTRCPNRRCNECGFKWFDEKAMEINYV